MSQIATKFIQDNAVTDLKMRLRNNLPARARNAADSADVSLYRLSNTDIYETLREMSMTNNKITNVTNPTDAQDAATKNYVDNAVAGLSDPKESVRVATTAALPAATYDNGASGVGATLTADASGALPSIDGVGLAVGDRLLVKNQGDAIEHGVYVVTQLGDAGTPWILTRAEDANLGSADDDPNEPEDDNQVISQGMFVLVAEGTTNVRLGYILTTQDDIALGTTPLNFTQFGEVVQAGQGLTKTGQTPSSIDEGVGLGYDGNQLVVLVDDDLVDGTTKILGGGEVASRRSFKEPKTLSATDVSNGYVDLAKVASRDSIVLQPAGGPKQNEALDFTVSYLGGASSKSRVTFAGDLASGGNAALADGDTLYFTYDSLDY